MANPLRKIIESDKGTMRRLNRTADQVETFADEMAALSDEELQAKTPYFRELLQNGKTLIFCLKPLRLSAKVHAVYWACTHSVCKSWVLPFCTVETLPKCVPVKVRL